MKPFEHLKEKIRESAHLNSAMALLSWDQEVMMPPGGTNFRAETIATLSGMYHDMMVIGVADALKAVEDAGLESLSPFELRNYRSLRWQMDRMTKLPKELVIESNRIRSEALSKWVEAKKKQDFSIFSPVLAEIVRLKREEANYYGFEEHPYDALMASYEPGMTSSRLRQIFEPFKAQLGEILPQIAAQPQIDDAWIMQSIPAATQLEWSRSVLQTLNYDFNHGRQDLSAHPFSMNLNPEDVRITTMVLENDIRDMLYSSIHETGHALYEMGIPGEHFGLPAGEYCSLGIHESQSRLWENNVARSREFWEHFFPSFRELFPDKLKGRGPEDCYRAANKVERGFIRIQADELTYHFHVALRFEIEHALIGGEVEVADLPSLWNSKVKHYLGLTVPNDAEGLLQDIHWSHGSIGYFPTYSLGSFYAAQFMDTARERIPGLDQQFARGEFGTLKTWLNQEIHTHGRQYDSEGLCTLATGKPLDVSHFIRYAKQKFGDVYGTRFN
ncbi:MAG: carboxypeptidase M32 [Bacteroidia bacterium]